MRAAASWLREQLAFAGGRVVETDGHPVVLGEWLGAPGAPTILVYGHYDVQPPGDEAEWESPPFEPTVRDGRIYARGATDDKGPVFVALKVAEAFHSAAAGGCRSTSASSSRARRRSAARPSRPFCEAHRDELAADLVVSADGAMWRPTEPSIAIAAKGLLALDLIVTGPSADLHSGRHGGAVQNPNHALAAILAGLHAPDGAVAVAGLLRRRRAARRARPRRARARPVRRGGLPPPGGRAGAARRARLHDARAALDPADARGERASRAAAPSRSSRASARAHITCRLVPGQRPEAILAAITRHIEAHVPPGVEVRVEAAPGAVPAYSIAADHPAVAAAVAALRTVYPDREPLLVRIGGTLPAAVLFEQILGLKTLLFSFSTVRREPARAERVLPPRAARGGHARLGRALDATRGGSPVASQSSSSRSAASMNCCDAGSSGAMWPHDDGIARHSAFAMWRASYSASTGGK